jgi:hypothetical protein
VGFKVGLEGGDGSGVSNIVREGVPQLRGKERKRAETMSFSFKTTLLEESIISRRAE